MTTGYHDAAKEPGQSAVTRSALNHQDQPLIGKIKNMKWLLSVFILFICVYLRDDRIKNRRRQPLPTPKNPVTSDFKNLSLKQKDLPPSNSSSPKNAFHNVTRQMIHKHFSRYRHLTSASVLHIERRKHFLQVLDGYYKALSPRDASESELVDDIAFNTWSKRRMRSMLTALIDHEMETWAPMHPNTSGAALAAIALRCSINQSRIIEVLNRFEHQYSQNATVALRTLTQLRKEPKQ